MYVKEFFYLNDAAVEQLYSWTPKFGFNGYGEIVFYRTFSRKKEDGTMETWNDTCLRVINGIMSIRKNHYVQNNIEWHEEYWQQFAFEMLKSMFNMEWLPPGRGLWQCGSQYMYERGSAALNNCGFTEVTFATMADDMAWAMNMLMVGVGIGFRLNRTETHVRIPNKEFYYIIPDSREGWSHSVRLLIAAYTSTGNKPFFDYSQIRGKNKPIKGFGGTASGADPLIALHKRIDSEFRKFAAGQIDVIELQANIANAIAVAVLAGNVRRSAEILQSEVFDQTFLDLKDGRLKPDRLDISWTSNNSAIFTTPDSFNLISEIANRVIEKGEPGGVNQNNLIYGRLNPSDITAVTNGSIKKDRARGFNPCGEQQLEHRELCCLVNTFPTRCLDSEGKYNHGKWLYVLTFAQFYAQTVTLLPTDDPTTNAVMQRNRRIGVAISDFTGWVHAEKLHNVINYLKEGYARVRDLNRNSSDESGTPHSIRLTTVKPDGTITKLVGVTSGAGNPTFRHTLRRTRVAKDSPIAKILIEAGLPYEPDVNQPDSTLVFEYPILQGPARPISEVSIWEQAANIVVLQRYWSDNAVSNTIYFEPDEYLIARITGAEYMTKEELDAKIPIRTSRIEKEEYEIRIYEKNYKSETHVIEKVISWMMPMVKSFSLLPKSGPGVYPQMPESELTEEEYNERLAALKPIDWSKLTGSEATGVRFCTADSCEV